MRELLDKKEDQPEPTNKAESIAEKLSFKSRFVLVFGEIDHALAQVTCERLIALAQESDAPIRVLVSSPGGHVESGDAIHDMIRFVRAPVTMIGTGWVASAGTHIFLAAPKERRFCLPNTRFMIHQPGGGAAGHASDIAIQARKSCEHANALLASSHERPVSPSRRSVMIWNVIFG